MEGLWTVAVVLLVIAALWFLAPYFSWRPNQSLESHVARTSFQTAPGELVPPAWKAPEVALSVVVPAYNEEFRLPQMLEETLNYLDARAAASSSFSYEVIVVDDGSRDATYAAAVRCAIARRGDTFASSRGGELRIMQLTGNHGKGFAVRAGMLVARGRYLLMADADGATSIRDFERLEAALWHPQPQAYPMGAAASAYQMGVSPSSYQMGGMQMMGGMPSGTIDDRGVHIAFGSRHHLKEEAVARRPFARNLLMYGLHLVVTLLVGWEVSDTQCGFKLFHASVGKKLFASLHLSRWAFDVELVVLARLLGLRIAEVPVTWVDMPGSKLGLALGALTMLRDIIMVRVLYLLGIWRPAVMA